MKSRSLQRDVAHICGWTDMIAKPGTQGVLHGRHASIPASNVFGTDGVPVPNFPGDLNAMQVAETMLKPEEYGRYLAYIAGTIEGDCDPVWKIRHAPAAVLASAFLQIIRERSTTEIINPNGSILSPSTPS